MKTTLNPTQSLPVPAAARSVYTLITDLMETRDMCGNEAETIQQWEADYGRLSASELTLVRSMLETQWTQAQADAGVAFPLSSDERANAYRDLRP